MSIEHRLENLLEEAVDDVVCREGSAFDAMTGRFGKSLVLFGAGGLGRKTLAGLRRVNIRPIAFSDNNPGLWGREIDGVPILKPEEAAGRFGDSAAFIVTIWRAGGGHRLFHTRQQLQTMNCSCVVSFAYLYWKYPEVFLPYYCIDLPHKIISQREDAMAAFRLLADEDSRQEYLDQIRFRLFLDFDGLPSPSCGVQYFPGSLFSADSEEVFVDCGAFDGDTIRAFMVWTGGLFKRIHAFEPDALNLRKLQEFIAALPEDVRSKMITHRMAAAEYRGELGFAMTGDASSSADTSAMTKVVCAPLDEVLAGESSTYIKMDIEGAELGALKGAAELIKRWKPVLAVGAYHQQDHLWRIPLYIHTLFPGYQVFLRPHNEEAWDLVCYAVPEERAVR
jgi:FkbM family methyltransferase